MEYRHGTAFFAKMSLSSRLSSPCLVTIRCRAIYPVMLASKATSSVESAGLEEITRGWRCLNLGCQRRRMRSSRGKLLRFLGFLLISRTIQKKSKFWTPWSASGRLLTATMPEALPALLLRRTPGPLTRQKPTRLLKRVASYISQAKIVRHM